MLLKHEKHGSEWRDVARAEFMAPLVEEGEQVYRSAVDLIRQADSGRIGTAMIQRRLRVGYNMAYRLMEMMERRGVVTGPDDQGIRTVKVQISCLLDQDRAAGTCWTFPWTEESSSVPRTTSRSAGTELTDKLTDRSSAWLAPWPRARRKLWSL